MKAAKPYANPYLAGVGLGLVLLAAFVFAGRGLGASGAFVSAAASLAQHAAPERTAANPYFARYLGEPGGAWKNWLVFELSGVVLGGFLSALAAGRLRPAAVSSLRRLTGASRVLASGRRGRFPETFAAL